MDDTDPALSFSVRHNKQPARRRHAQAQEPRLALGVVGIQSSSWLKFMKVPRTASTGKLAFFPVTSSRIATSNAANERIMSMGSRDGSGERKSTYFSTTASEPYRTASKALEYTAAKSTLATSSSPCFPALLWTRTCSQ